MAVCDFSKLMLALETPPESRSPCLIEEIKTQLHLTGGMQKLMQELNSPYLTAACAMSMELETYAPNEAMVQAGRQQKSFSILLSGIGAYLFPAHLMSLRTSISGKRFSDLKVRQTVTSRLGAGLFLTEPDQQSYMTLSPGDGLGFNAFGNEITNLFSIYSKTHSVTAIIPVSTIKSYIAKLTEEALQVKVAFLKSLPGFSQFTHSYLSRLAYSFKEKTWGLNQIVYREGAKCEAIYAIKSGLVEFSQEDVGRKRGVPKKLYIKSAGEIFGEQDLIFRETYSSTAISISSATVLYSLSIEVFRELINKTKLASQLTSKSQELEDFYSAREYKPNRKKSPKFLSLKMTKSYSRHGSVPHAKLLEDLNRNYSRYKMKLRVKEKSVSPLPSLRDLSPIDSGTLTSATTRSPQNNEGTLSMTAKSVKGVMQEVRKSMAIQRSSSVMRKIRTTEVSPKSRLKTILKQKW